MKTATHSTLRDSVIVLKKELVDAIRDRKTLMMVFLTAVLIGPLMLVAMSFIVSQQEEKSERREVWVAGLEHAPELHNYLLRQGMKVNPAPADYEAQLKDFRLGESVILVAEDYREQQAKGLAPELRVVFDSANRQSTVLVGRNVALLDGFSREQGLLELTTRGVAPAVLQPFRIQERNLASAQSRSSQLTAMVPWMVMMAVLFGGLTVALDTTAGERERASLEPLLTNPITPFSLVLGKWGAAAVVAMSIAAISVSSFFPAKMLIQSEALQAMFRFGPGEAIMFLLMLLPLAAAVSAVLMLAAIYGRTYKEAQSRSTVALLAFQMAPMIAIMDFSGEKPWHLLVPSLAQQTVMLRVLRGDELLWQHLLVPTGISLGLTVVCLVVLAQKMKSLAIR
ncbi:MAG: sodium ABC transporter permease [Burkholderiales bacterium PBB4]|nr:MAG: sodium ABC transporter permease [Burkholderiales bacterium PBB4]